MSVCRVVWPVASRSHVAGVSPSCAYALGGRSLPNWASCTSAGCPSESAIPTAPPRSSCAKTTFRAVLLHSPSGIGHGLGNLSLLAGVHGRRGWLFLIHILEDRR